MFALPTYVPHPENLKGQSSNICPCSLWQVSYPMVSIAGQPLTHSDRSSTNLEAFLLDTDLPFILYKGLANHFLQPDSLCSSYGSTTVERQTTVFPYHMIDSRFLDSG